MAVPAENVIGIIDLLESRGLSVWLDGGWGVDALVGKQTRDHDDLDIAILLSEAQAVRKALHSIGYRDVEDEMPTRLDLRDDADRRVDLHPLTIDGQGNGLQQLQDGSFGTYTAEGLSATGVVDGRKVRCLSRALQLKFHTGYELDAKDLHDIELLQGLLP